MISKDEQLNDEDFLTLADFNNIRKNFPAWLQLSTTTFSKNNNISYENKVRIIYEFAEKSLPGLINKVINLAASGNIIKENGVLKVQNKLKPYNIVPFSSKLINAFLDYLIFVDGCYNFEDYKTNLILVFRWHHLIALD